MNKIKELFFFINTCLHYIADEKFLFIGYLVLCILAALSEGITVAMLAPILENQSGPSMFSNIPILGVASSYFKGMETTEKLQSVAVILGTFLLLRGMLIYSVEALGGAIPFRLQRNLLMRGYKSLLSAEYSYFTEKTVGDHTNSLSEWAARVTNVLTNFGKLIFNVILVFVYLSLMLSLSWKLALLGGLLAIVMSAILKSFTVNVLRRTGAELSGMTASLGELIFETISGMKFIKTSAAEMVMLPRYNKTLMEKIGLNIKMILYQSIVNPFLSTFAGIFICILLFVGPYLGEGEGQWIGGLLMFLFLLMRLLSPVSQIGSSRAQIASHIFALEALDNFFVETEQRRQPSGVRQAEGIKREIEFENISFQYPASEERAIYNISLKIPAGKMVAIVGPSGSGKSTLVSLLMRFYDPGEGRILIDGIDLMELNVYDHRRQVSVVSQDIFIFNDTVSNNLAFAAEGVSQDDIVRAAKLAAADEFIEKLPHGYDTKLGDHGVRLSGGQQQRIAIARAILRNPDLLIFDEATSHLDTFTEQAIQDAVEVLREDRTVLVIAHRLSTIRRADTVIVLKDGEVVEWGPHKELMAARGVYWDMVNHQSLGFVDEDETASIDQEELATLK